MVGMDKYYFEFTKLYSRLMRLELRMKAQIIKAVLPEYRDTVIEVFNPFFTEKRRKLRYETNGGNILSAILKNPQMTNANKFKNLIDKLYLSDILVFILNCVQFRRDNIIETFYYKIPSKFGTLTQAKKDLLNLRNAVAHYNFKDYEQNRNEYNSALAIFEEYVGSSIKGIELPKFNEKPSIKAILLSIREKREDLFDINLNKDDEYEYYYNKHRILLDLCDEIAILNGYSLQELPSPWTILRQMYAIKQEFTNNADKNIPIKELPLFKALEDF